MRCLHTLLSILLLASILEPALALPDLDVAYISRTPRCDRYNVSYQYGVDPNDYWTGKPYLAASEQTKKRWPSAGETVTYAAVIKNPGNAATGPFSYKWYFDGIEVKSGTLSSIAVGGQTSTSYSRAWDSEQNTHLIKFVADPQNAIAEDIETNNSREDPTNALTFRFHVWQSLYNWFRTNARLYAPQIASWDDWAQQQVYHMNRMFSEAVFPNAPNGILERVRLDEIVVEPDSTPDPGGTHAPDDWPWDGRWGFSNGYLGPPNFYEQNPWVLQNYEGSLMHELSHQIGMIDLYVLNIENGQNRIVSTINHPNTREGGMMTGNYSRYSDHTAYALNTNLHKRRGFYGEYLYDVPQTCRLRVVDAYYRPLPGATLTFYQDKDRAFDPPAKFTLISDAGGYATLPNRTCYGSITTATGHTLRDNPWGLINVVGANAVFFVKIEAAGQTWSPMTSPVTNNLNAVDIHPSTGLACAVGDAGTVLIYSSGSWMKKSIGTAANLRACAIASASVILIGGSSGTLYRSVNGGSSFTRLYVTSSTIRSIRFLDANNGIFVGEGPVAYYTTNGGANWTSGTGYPANWIIDCAYPSSTEAWA